MSHSRLVPLTITLPPELIARLDGYADRHAAANPGEVANRSRLCRWILTNGIAGIEQREQQSKAKGNAS